MRKQHSLILLFAVLLTGCDILNVEPTSQIEASDAFKDKKGVTAALNGAYDILQSPAISQDVIVFGDLPADNLIHIGTKKEYRQISDQHVFTENAYVEGIWNDSYDGINRLNNIIERIDEAAGMTEEEKEEVLGQCYFLRAYHYFNLVKFFGGVPIKEFSTTSQSPDELNAPRKSKEEVYDFLISDLGIAGDLLEGTGRRSTVYADEGAVKGLLARAFLYTGQYAEALSMATGVMGMGYELVEGADYSAIFDETRSNNEVIFQIDFLNDNETSGMADWFLPDGRFEVSSWDTPAKESSIFDLFGDEDLRKTTSIGESDITGSLEYYGNKYTDYVTNNDATIILRLAEIYLLAAEAGNEIAYVPDGEAFGFLNAVRIRAGLNALTSTELPDQEAFRLAVEQERRLELCFEGHRYFDLVRTGRAAEVLPQLGPLTGVNQYLFPIPRSEFDTNESITENNPGY
jgi:hypothetical protein